MKEGLAVKRIGPIVGFIFAVVFLVLSLCCFRRRKILLQQQFAEERENDSYHVLENSKNGNAYGIDKETLAITRMKTKDKPALDKALGLDESEDP